MKKLLSVFSVLFCIVVSAASAQSYSYTATIQLDPVAPYTYDAVPICSWNKNYSVTFVRGGGKTMFNLVDHSDFYTIHPGPIPVPGSLPAPACSVYHAMVQYPVNISQFDVNDIFIADEYVFFCGSLYDDIPGAQLAMWGYFNINDFFTTSLNIEIRTLSVGSITAPDVLKKLVAYKIGGRYHMVAYGREALNDKVVEVTDALSTTTPYLCNVSNIQFFYYQPVRIYDMVLTDTYVVFLTIDIFAEIGYCRGHRGSVVIDLSTELNRFIPISHEVNNVLAGVALPDDQFAMSYVYLDINNNIAYTRLRVFDLATDLNIYSYEFQKPDKEDPVKMVYLDKLKMIELMQPIQDSMDYIQLDPYAVASYSTSGFVPGGREYRGMSKMDGQRFITTSGPLYYLQDRTVTLPHSTVACPDDYQKDVVIIPNEVASPYYNNNKYDNSVNSFQMTAAPILHEKLDPQCFSFESK